MKRFVLSLCVFLFVIAFSPENRSVAWGVEEIAARQTVNTGRILKLQQRQPSDSPVDIEFMVHIVFADAMNTERWVNRWVRKNHIPAVTHLAVSTGAENGGREAFTVFQLSKKESYRIRVIRGLQGHPEVQRWMSVEGLHRFFRELTTEKGAVQVVEAGSFGMKGLQLGLRLKKVMDDLHDQGLMRSRAVFLTKFEERRNRILQHTLAR